MNQTCYIYVCKSYKALVVNGKEELRFITDELVDYFKNHYKNLGFDVRVIKNYGVSEANFIKEFDAVDVTDMMPKIC